MRQLNSKRLSAYSLLSTAFLTISNDATAQIVYTDIDPDFQINYGGTLFGSEELTYEIDFDQDGITDVSFYFYSYAYNKIIYNSKYISFNLNPASGNSFMFDSLASESAFGPAKLGGGVKVGPVANWENEFSSTMFYDYWYRSFLAQSSSSSGNWKHADENFVGIKFRTNGEIHYGWVRLSLEQYPGKKPKGVITIHDLAYEATAGKIITTPVKLSAPDQLVLKTNEFSQVKLDFYTPVNNNAIDEYRIFLVPSYNLDDINNKSAQLNDHYTSFKNPEPASQSSMILKNKDWNGAPLLPDVNYYAFVLSYNTSFLSNDLSLSNASNPITIELKEDPAVETEPEMNIYSVADIVHLNFTDELYLGSTAKIYSIDGKELMVQQLNDLQNEMTLAGAEGIYLINIQKGSLSINKMIHIGG